MERFNTINEAFLEISARGDKTAWMWQQPDGAWQPISSAEVYARVRALSAALERRGVGKGDRVAILSENRWEWPAADFAVLALGAVDVPLYLTLPPDQIGYMLRDSGAKVAIVSTREQYDKVRAAGEMPQLEHVIVMDEGSYDGAETFATLLAEQAQPAAKGQRDGASRDGTSRDGAFDERARSAQPDDLATVIYTSGTTGEPKGVMLTHGNLARNFSVSTGPFRFSEDDSCISFLPLSHVTARHLDYALMCDGVTVAYCPKFDQIREAMQAVKPTIFVAVPRVYEKIRQGVEGNAHGLKGRLLGWALHVGHEQRPATLAGRPPAGFDRWVADKLVFAKIRAAFGGRVRLFVSGGAPLGTDTAGWFADVGIRILEGYGLTETSPVIALNYPDRYRLGTVGQVIQNVEVRFAPDGELEVRGPSVFRGYWNKEKETAEAFTQDGWFKTGDIGKLDRDGYLSITDRKKELLKTSGGKLIAPQPIENKLKAHALVGNAALIGDKHKFACVLLSPNFGVLESWAKAKGVSFKDHADLVQQERVVARYQKIVDDVNGCVAPYETMKRLAVVQDEWSVDGGEMTPSMKLKRRVIEDKYKTQIENFYKDEATASKQDGASN